LNLFNPNEYLIKLKGKDYLEVKWRLVWFRDENNPKDRASITLETEIIQDDGEQGLVKATAKDGDGRILATGMKREHKREFHDYIEKAETGAIGRVLAILGYGTQFAEELELPEGKLVDSPIETKEDREKKNATSNTKAKNEAPQPDAREIARQKAEERALAKKAEQEAKGNSETDAPAQEANSGDVVEPINENQLKAITKMVEMLSKKKNISPDDFLKELAGKFGKSSLNDLTFEEGKQVIPLINQAMRA
jgi:hypothetical protein